MKFKMNDEIRMTNDECGKKPANIAARASSPALFIRHSAFGIRHFLRFIRHSAFGFILGAILSLGSVLSAQEAQPEAEPLAPSTNPAVLSALESPRKEPIDYVRAILALVDLGEAPRAVPIVEELAKLQISPEQRAELVEKIGSAAMLRIAQSDALGPAAKEFVETTMEAAATAATSPERLAQLVEQLSSPSADIRRTAAVKLASTGTPGAKYAIAALADARDENQRAGLQQALVGLAPLSTPLLFAVLESGSDAMRANAIAVLSQTGGNNAATMIAVPALLEPADSAVGNAARQAFQQITKELATPAVAEQLLRLGIKNYLAGTPPFRPDGDGLVEMWSWNADQKDFTSARLTIPDAGVVRAARLADDLARLKAGDSAAERQAMLLGLEADWILGKADSTPVDLTNVDPLQLNQTLTEALANNRYGTAIALVNELGKRGDSSVLFTADGKPSPLAAALDSPHPQVRYAALSAIMQLDPKSPFAGSSRVAEVLTRIARSTGSQRAVVAMPPIERAASLAGQLAVEQIVAAPVEVGRDAIAQGALSPDVEFVLVDMTIDRPDVREVLFQLRRTPATGLTPIGILAPAGRLEAAQQIASEHRGVQAFSRPHLPEANAAIVEKLALRLPRGWPTPPQRSEQASQALKWIDKLLSDGPKFYNLRGRPVAVETALTTPAIPTAAALATLAKVGTAASQRTLVTYVNQSVLPMEIRQQSAAAFAEAVDQFGLLLTTDEIRQQYDFYNASETADAETQKLLGAVLDAIEKQSRQKAEGRRQ